uniref:Uncharacterized protein n=1 Tax=Anguilla anguilla TaxID=7936 RepID=A0A0E9RST1_ANGAN
MHKKHNIEKEQSVESNQMSFDWQSILKGTCRVASSVVATRPRINGGSPRGDESWLPDCT